MMKLTSVSRIIIALSACMMVSAFFVPLWRILMWAPQYPEWLELKIWVNAITGDVNTINGLNHYIGMKYIRTEMFPEFTYMPYIVGFLIGFGILTAIVNRRWILITYFTLLVGLAIAGLTDFYLWAYDYGHNLDPGAAIKVPGMSYQPPIIGTKQLLNFTAFSGPDVAGWMFLGAGILVLITILAEKFYFKTKASTE